MLVDERQDFLGAGNRVEGTGGERRAHLLGHVTSGHLVAEFFDRVGRRPDPGQPSADDGTGEVGILREGSRWIASAPERRAIERILSMTRYVSALDEPSSA